MPDRFIIISALGSCSIECFLKKGKRFNVRLLWLLALIWMQWFRLQMALLDMYNKCSDLEYSERYFSGIFLRSIGAYNAMIGGYVLNALPLEAFSCLKKMQEDDKLVPEQITVIHLQAYFLVVHKHELFC